MIANVRTHSPAGFFQFSRHYCKWLAVRHGDGIGAGSAAGLLWLVTIVNQSSGPLRAGVSSSVSSFAFSLASSFAELVPSFIVCGLACFAVLFTGVSGFEIRGGRQALGVADQRARCRAGIVV